MSGREPIISRSGRSAPGGSRCGSGSRRSRDAAPERRNPVRNRTGHAMQQVSTKGQLLHLVFGGELTSSSAVEFADLKALDIVGIFPNYATAEAADRKSTRLNSSH